MRYRIEGACCQLGVWCRFPCDACQKVDFIIHDSIGNQVGFLQKRTAGCCKSMMASTAHFSLEFPKDASKEDKALLLAAVIMLDFTYFEEKPGRRR